MIGVYSMAETQSISNQRERCQFWIVERKQEEENGYGQVEDNEGGKNCNRWFMKVGGEETKRIGKGWGYGSVFYEWTCLVHNLKFNGVLASGFGIGRLEGREERIWRGSGFK